MKTNNRQGFTRSELLVVIGVVGTFACLIMPALANPKSRGDKLTCAGNLRQLIQSWGMYSSDNSGRLVMNFQGGEALGGAAAANGNNVPWAMGWLDWTSRSDNTNIQFLIDDKYSKLAKYIDQNPEVFRCPSDRFVSAAQRQLGWTHRARSFSLSLGIGDGDAEAGPWNNVMYRHIKTIYDFRYPAPSETFIFLDENPDSINDPGFFPPQAATAWTDQPASYHDGAGNFAFADGHLEIKKWTASLASSKAAQIHFVAANTTGAFQTPDDDLHWVSYHSQRVSSNSY